MVEETWSKRDLPVLKAIVELHETHSPKRVEVSEVERATGLDNAEVQQALKALHTEPYIQGGFKQRGGGSGLVYKTAGAPTAAGLRAAGAWPTPESLLERLVAGLEAAAEEEGRPEEERGKLKSTATWLGSFASQVAINALGGAGGNMLS